MDFKLKKNSRFLPMGRQMAAAQLWTRITFLVVIMCGLFLPSPAQAAALLMPQDSAPRDHARELTALLDWINQQRGTIIAMQRELVALPAINPEHGGTGEEAKLQWVEKRLRSYGITNFERFDYIDHRVPGDVRGNLIAMLPGLMDGSPARRTLWLLSHLDVFPAGPLDEWKGDPFTLRVEGDLIYGRGTEENNQAIVTSLLLVEALHSTGIVPRLNIGLLFGAGALTDYETNIKYVLEKKPDLFSPGDFILLMDYGSESGAFIEVAEKGNVWLKFTVTGKETHASIPSEGVNALAAGVEFLHALRGLDNIFPATDPLFNPPNSTFTPTMVENHSKALNHIPGRFVFFVDARLIPAYSLEDLCNAIRELTAEVSRHENAQIDFEILEEVPSSGSTPANAPIVRLLGRAVREQLGVMPELGGIGGVTMASAIRNRGFAIAVWAIQKNWRNKAEEFSSITSHLNQTKVLARLLFDTEAVGPGSGNGDETGSAAPASGKTR